MKKFIGRAVLAGILSVIVLYYLFSNFDLVTIFSRVDFLWYVVGLGFYLVVLLVRTLRFKILRAKPSFGELSKIVMVYNLLNYLLPFRLGEFSYGHLLKKSGKGSHFHGLSSIVISRIMDFTVLFLALCSGIFLSGNMLGAGKLVLVSAAVLTVLLACLFIVIHYPGIAEYLIKNIPYLKRSDKLKEFLHYFSQYKPTLALAFAITLLTYLGGLATTYAILRSFGVELMIGPLVFVVTASALSGIIPLSGFAGLGPYEGFFVVSLSMTGIPITDAVSLAFATHVVQITYVIILGLFALPRTRLM